MSEPLDSSKRGQNGNLVNVSAFKEDPRIEIARGGSVSFSKKTLERLGIVKESDNSVDLREALMEVTGGRHFKGGTLKPEDQAKKDRAILHIQRKDARRKVAKENVDVLREEAAKIIDEMKLYPERASALKNRLRGILHYIDLGEGIGKTLIAEAIEDGRYAFEKEVESQQRENQRNLRTYKEEHVQTVTFQDLKRKIEAFENE